MLCLQVVAEWKAKVDDLSAEVECSQKECRNYNSEIFRLKAAWDETVEQLDVVKRENKNLADEIRDLLDQLGLLISGSGTWRLIWRLSVVPSIAEV